MKERKNDTGHILFFLIYVIDDAWSEEFGDVFGGLIGFSFSFLSFLLPPPVPMSEGE